MAFNWGLIGVRDMSGCERGRDGQYYVTAPIRVYGRSLIEKIGGNFL